MHGLMILAPIAGKGIVRTQGRSNMEFTLYTLPTCGICHMIKTKLENKNISFKEENFSEIAELLQVDHAPVLKMTDSDKVQFITSPSEMAQLINNYVG